MLANRIRVAIILIPIGILFVILGGYFYLALITIMLAIAAMEYSHLFIKGGYSPAQWLLVPGVILLAISRYFWEFEYTDVILAGFTLAAMAYHTVQCKDGCRTPAADFAITIGGLMYIGWIGSYMVTMRNIDNGLWWSLIAFPAISMGDAGAYFIGSKFGRHKLAPYVSPKKTIEGYFGGVLFTILGGALMAWICSFRSSGIEIYQGLILGAVLGVFTPLGDLGESMLKRQFGVKDSGTIFGGHGGMMDRMDSWIWGAVLGYYLIIWFW